MGKVNHWATPTSERTYCGRVPKRDKAVDLSLPICKICAAIAERHDASAPSTFTPAIPMTFTFGTGGDEIVLEVTSMTVFPLGEKRRRHQRAS